MQTTSGPIDRTDRNIARRMITLGVIGFLLLTVVFFSFGFFYVGPRMKSSTQQGGSSRSAPVYTPPRTSDRSYIGRMGGSRDEEGAAIDLEVTEHRERTDDEAQESDGLRHDERSLTVILDAEHGADREGSQESASERRDANSPHVGSDESNLGIKKPLVPKGTSHAERGAPERPKIFRVQVGTFADENNAENLASDLQGKGFKASVNVVQVENHTLYRVQVGRFRTREDAQELANDLSATGYSPVIAVDQNGN